MERYKTRDNYPFFEQWLRDNRMGEETTYNKKRSRRS